MYTNACYQRSHYIFRTGSTKSNNLGKKHLSTTNVNIWSTVSHSMSMVITALPVVHWTSQMFYRRVMTPVHDPVRLSLRLYWTCALISSLIFHSSYHSPCITPMQGVNVFYSLVLNRKWQLLFNKWIQYNLILLVQQEIVFLFIYMIIYFQIVHKQVQSDINVIVWKTEGRAF